MIMIGHNDKDAYIKNMSVYAADVITKTEELSAGYTIGHMKFGNDFYAHMAINDNFCLIAFNNKDQGDAKAGEAMMTELLSYGASEGVLNDYSKMVLDSDKDMIMAFNFEKISTNKDFKMAMNNTEGMLTFEEYEKKSKDGYTITSMNFGTGELELDLINSYPNMPEMSEMTKMALPEEYAYLLTNNKLVGFAGAQVEMDAYKRFIEKREVNIVTKFVKKYGINLNEVMDVFDGSASISVIGINNIEEIVANGLDGSFESGEEIVDDSFHKLNGFDEEAPEIEEAQEIADMKASMANKSQDWINQVVITIGLNDDQLLKTVLDTSKNVTKEGDMYRIMIESNNPTKRMELLAAIKDKHLMISGDKDVINQFNGSGKLIMAYEAKDYMASPFNGLVSFNTIVNLFEAAGGEELMQLKFLRKLDVLELKGDLNHVTLKLKTIDQTNNILKQLTDELLEDQDKVMGILSGMVM